MVTSQQICTQSNKTDKKMLEMHSILQCNDFKHSNAMTSIEKNWYKKVKNIIPTQKTILFMKTKLRHYHVIVTSLWRHNDVIMTSEWRHAVLHLSDFMSDKYQHITKLYITMKYNNCIWTIPLSSVVAQWLAKNPAMGLMSLVALPPDLFIRGSFGEPEMIPDEDRVEG